MTSKLINSLLLFLLFTPFTLCSQNYTISKYSKIQVTQVNDIQIDNQNIKWITSVKGLYQIIDTSIYKQLLDSTLIDLKLKSIYIDSYNNIWLGTYNSLILKIYNNNLISKIDLYPSINENIIINSITEDNEFNLWFASTNKELIVYNNVFDTISYRVFLPSIPRIIYIDSQNTKYIGTESGLFSIDNQNRLIQIKNYGQINSIKEFDNCIYFVSLENTGSTFWKFDKISKRTTQIQLPQNLEITEISDFEIDTINNLFIFGSNCIAFYNYITQECKYLAIESKSIRCLQLDNENTLWIGTEGKGVFNCIETFIPSFNLSEISFSNSEIQNCNSLVKTGTKIIPPPYKYEFSKDTGTFYLNYNMSGVADKLTIISGSDTLFTTFDGSSNYVQYFNTTEPKIKKIFDNRTIDVIPIRFRYPIIYVILEPSTNETSWSFIIYCPE